MSARPASRPDEPVRLVHVTTVPVTLNFLRGHVGYMQRQGVEVHALSSPGPELDTFGSEESVSVHAVDMPRRITPIRDLASTRRIARVLKTIRPHIVHAHTPKGGLLGMVAAALVRTPVRVYHMRGLPYMTATGRRRILLKATERISCRLAHRVICVSRSLQDVALRDGLCPQAKLMVLAGGSGNGVDATVRFDPARFSAHDRLTLRAALGVPGDAPVIGFVGRIVADKGIHELAAAWQRLRDDFPTARLVIVGPREPQDPVEPAVMQHLESDSRVIFTGSRSDTEALYAAFDLVTLPTYREGFPNVPLEAAAMGLPVVATAIPGCIDAVRDGVTGTLVPVRDSDALASAITRYLADPGLRSAHGKAGRERVVRDFRQEVIWEALYQEYRSLLAAKGIMITAGSGTS